MNQDLGVWCNIDIRTEADDDRTHVRTLVSQGGVVFSLKRDPREPS